MIKIFAVSVIVSLISVVLKKHSEEFLLPFKILSASILLLFIIKEGYGYISAFFSFLSGYYKETIMISGLLKASIVAVITKLTCDVCNETGNKLIQDIVELGGRIMIFIITLPYISDILNVILSFVD